jgi:ATP-dependent Clp protease ATP-binding subunit ClpC
LNRIDDVFNALEKHDIDLIIEIELKNYLLACELGYQLNLSDKAKAFMLRKVLINNLAQDH